MNPAAHARLAAPRWERGNERDANGGNGKEPMGARERGREGPTRICILSVKIEGRKVSAKMVVEPAGRLNRMVSGPGNSLAWIMAQLNVPTPTSPVSASAGARGGRVQAGAGGWAHDNDQESP